MGYKLTKNSGEEFPKVPVGNHRCCIVAVTELGTHTEQAFVQGQPDKDRFKIQIVYELLDEEREGNAGPWVIGHVYTASSFKDAPIVKAVSAALQRPVGEDEEPDLEKIVGKVVMVEVVHEAGKKDPSKVYDKIKSVTPIATLFKKMPVKPVNPPAYFELGSYIAHDWHPRIFGAKVADFIGQSQEGRRGFRDADDDDVTAFEDALTGKDKPDDDILF
jgi:hypothetical protein